MNYYNCIDKQFQLIKWKITIFGDEPLQSDESLLLVMVDFGDEPLQFLVLTIIILVNLSSM